MQAHHRKSSQLDKPWVPHVSRLRRGFRPQGQAGVRHLCKWLTTALLAAATLYPLGSGLAQTSLEPPQSSNTPPTTLHVNAQFVLLDVAVTNRKTGEIIGPLTLNDLDVTEDGTPQKLTYLSHDELPLSLIFLFDITDTVRPVLHNLAQGANGVVQHLGQHDEAAVLIFSSHTERLLGFARRHDLIADAISRAAEKSTHEATFLNEDMFEAVDMLPEAKEPQSRRVLLWLTDGTSNSEDGLTKQLHGKHAPDHLHTEQEATEALLRSGAASAMLQQVSIETQTNALNGRTDRFQRFAELTGGPVLNTGNTGAAQRMSLLLDNLRARTTVGFRPSTPRPPGTHCKLKITLTPAFFTSHPKLAAQRKDLVIQARKEYVR